MSDLRIPRDRQETTDSLIHRLAAAGHGGSETILARTKSLGTYPATASAFFACGPLRIDGSETEGAEATFAEDESRTIMAFNIGSRIPPVGTKLIVHSSGGRWVFRHDG